MQLTHKESDFLAKRAWLVRAWPVVGTLLLFFVLGLGVWLFLSRPLLANPFVVMARLKDDSISSSILSLMAGLLPVVVLMCVVLALAIVLFGFAAFAIEKKYIALIERWVEPAGSANQGNANDSNGAEESAPRDAGKRL
jgi:hypothetical protein